MIRLRAPCFAGFVVASALRAGKQQGDDAPSSALAAANASATRLALSDLQQDETDKTGIPWCRPRPCWSAQHHGHEPQGDRPLCADAMFNFLVAMSEKLNAGNYDWQICQGTLLGAVRDKDIIPWTADVDICLRTESWMRLKAAAVPRGNGWEQRDWEQRPSVPQWLPDYTFGYDSHQVATLFRGCEDFKGQPWHFLRYSDSSVMYADISDSDREPWPQPSRMREIMAGPKQMVEIRGKLFPAPADAEEELNIFYGPSWRIPNSTTSSHGVWKRR